LFSDVVSIRAGRRLVLSGFQTVYKTQGAKNLEALDKKVDEIVDSAEEPVLIDLADGIELLKLAYDNLEFDDDTDDDRKAHIAALEHLSATCKRPELKGKVWLMVEKRSWDAPVPRGGTVLERARYEATGTGPVKGRGHSGADAPPPAW